MTSIIKHRFKRGDIIDWKGFKMLLRYSHFDLHGWCQEEKYKLALVRSVACQEFGHSQQEYEAGGYPIGYVAPDDAAIYLGKVDDATTKRIELYAGQCFDNDKYRAKSSLTFDEWQDYIRLIDRFAEAKEKKQYDVSDKLRKELSQWQDLADDIGYMEMAKTGKYVFHPVFRTKHL